MRRVGVTGAGGFVGQWLVKALVARGDAVRVLLRSGEAPPGTSLVRGDLTNVEALRALSEGCDTVFHLAGVRRAATRDDFMEVNARGTQRLGEALVKAGAQRLVLCGSLAASGPSAGRPRVESDPFEPQEWYGESKAEAERIAFSFGSDLQATVSRPCRILGPGDVENLSFVRPAARGIVLKLLGPERRLSFVDVDDVVAHLLVLGDHPAAVGEAFFCASTESRTVEAFMRDVAVALHQTPRAVPIPSWLLEAVAAGADAITQVTGYKLPLNRKLARQLLAPGWECSIEKSKRLLGWLPTVTLEQSLQRSLNGYRQAGVI